MSATETPLVTPDEIIRRLNLEIDGYRMREQVGKEANDKMRADLAARDALIGELRDVLRGEAEWSNGINSARANRLREALARTPADAGAELERLKLVAADFPVMLASIADYVNVLAREVSAGETPNFQVGNIKEAIGRIYDALRAQLATAEAKLSDEKFEHAKTTDLMHSHLRRAESAEARLAAVLGALEAAVPELDNYINDCANYEAPEGLDHLSRVTEDAKQVLAARTGVAAHPDTATVNWLIAKDTRAIGVLMTNTHPRYYRIREELKKDVDWLPAYTDDQESIWLISLAAINAARKEGSK